MSELTGSQKENTAYVLREIFGISCEKPSDKIAEVYRCADDSAFLATSKIFLHIVNRSGKLLTC